MPSSHRIFLSGSDARPPHADIRILQLDHLGPEHQLVSDVQNNKDDDLLFMHIVSYVPGSYG